MNTAAHALPSYVPRLLHRRLAEGAPIAAPEAQSGFAAVLLSDIQGFTSLVEGFTSAGRAGLEELTWVLNSYFADLVEEVYAHGGDVLCIAGDAFLCYWPAESADELADTALRAAQAGVAIQARLHGRDAGRGRSFATRIGVAAGELSLAFVGGVGGRWELIADGRALHEAAAAEKACAPGEVVLSPAARRLVAVRAPLPPRALPARSELRDAEALLRPFMPPAVLDRFDSDVAWLAEQRTVTVLMADLPELGDATAENLERTHAGVRAFQQVIERFEGTLRVDIDDKGVMVLAAFGLPPRAHENDALRAVHAARALREAFDLLGVRCGIGIATGRAFCGAFGSDLRREYMLRGDVVNLAARLMRAADAAVVCDHATVQSVRGRIAFEALAPISVKGRSQPVQVYRPLGRSERVQRVSAPMIGRLREQSLLEAQLAALLGGADGGLVVVEAEAGLGKSRLLAELGERAEASGVRVLTAVAEAIESNTAYYAWRPVFAAVFGIDAGQDGEAARAHVMQKMAQRPELERLLPLLAAVLPIQIADNELTQEMTGEVRAENTRQLLARLLQHEAATLRTLLELEDAHWLDSNSWSLLLEVLQSVRPLLTVVTTRPPAEPVPQEYHRLARLAGENILRLEALAEADMAALMRQRLGVRELPVALFKLVQARTAGHPFFCEELLQGMLESGAIRVEDGVCRAGDLNALELPTSVEGVILSRLDRLSAAQQLCLKVASVIGRSFRERTLHATLPLAAERGRVPGHLAALNALSLTAPEAPPPDPSHLFRHVITRDVTYELMPLAQRQPLHRAVAEWLEREHAEDLEPHCALLAYHWARALDAVKTVGYLERAGQQALRSGAFTEALLFFSQAIELDRGGKVATDAVRRAFWQKGLGTAHYFLGDLAKSRTHLEAAVGLLDRPVPVAGAKVLGGMLAAAFEQALHRLFPKRYLGRRVPERAALDEAAECYRTLGQIYYLDGEPAPRLVYVTLRGVNVGEAAGPSPALARNLSNMGTLCGFSGAQKWADWYARRAVGMAEQEGQYAAAAYVWSINSLTEAQRGNWKAAKAANAEALRRVQQLGDYNVEAEVWVIRATVNICEGDFAAAPEAWQHARALAERSGNAQILCWSLLDEVDTLLGRGDTEGAAKVLDAALAVPTAASDGSSTIDKQRATAMTRLRQQRYAEAVVAADVVVEMVTRQPPTGYHWLDFCASAIEVYLSVLEEGGAYALEHRELLEARAARGCKALAKLSRIFGNVRPRAWLLRGMLHLRRGESGKALHAFRRAEAIAVAMDMPFEQARALCEIGRLEEGEARASSGAAAAVIFERLGAAHYVALAARLTPAGSPPP